MQVTETLAQRGARYGKFIEHAEIAQGLQNVLAKGKNWPTLDYDMRQALCVICDKIARILNGDPYHSDNFHDIAGYAMLVDARLKELEQQEVPSLYEDAIMPEIAHSEFVSDTPETIYLDRITPDCVTESTAVPVS